jgi:putative nucleotidyltransferase with HDIG domain
VVYFLVNTIPVALIIAWDSDTSPFSQWRQEYLWYLPFYLVGAVLAAAANLVGIHFGWMTSLLLIPLVYIMYRAYSTQIDTVRDRERHIVEVEALQFRTIEGLAMAIEAKDQNTHRHLMRVRTYVSELGRIMGLDEPLMKALLTASFLHDIGKLAVPEHILNKPGRLTPEEFEKMKIHPVVGADILERVRFPYPVVPIVRSHHEAWNGSGYPDGLKGEEIPIGARILTAVDCLDALASERPYRKALPLAEAMEIVRSKAGSLFDPDIVRLLELHYLELEELAHRHIGEIEPLNTDMIVDRGAAPAAGFEAERTPSDSREKAPPYQDSSPVPPGAQQSDSSLATDEPADRSLVAREACSTMCNRVQAVIPFHCFAVYLVSGERLLPQYLNGPSARGFSSRPIPIGEGLSGWVVRNERPIVNGNPTVEPNYLSKSDLFSATGSALSIPLKGVSGAVIGALTVYTAEQTAYSGADVQTLQALQAEFSPLLEDILRFESQGASSGAGEAPEAPEMRHFLEQIDEVHPEIGSSAAL